MCCQPFLTSPHVETLDCPFCSGWTSPGSWPLYDPLSASVPPLSDSVVTFPYTCKPPFSSSLTHTISTICINKHSLNKTDEVGVADSHRSFHFKEGRDKGTEDRKEMRTTEFTIPAITETTYSTRHFFSIKPTGVSVNSSGGFWNVLRSITAEHSVFP